MNSILLSIKPEFVQKIIREEKRYEYRRRLCKQEIERIYIYATWPVKLVVAEAEVTGRMEGEKDYIWNATKEYAGINEAYFEDYFDGLERAGAYCLGKITVYDHGRPLSEFGLKAAPQSYAYVKKSDNSENTR